LSKTLDIPHPTATPATLQTSRRETIESIKRQLRSERFYSSSPATPITGSARERDRDTQPCSPGYRCTIFKENFLKSITIPKQFQDYGRNPKRSGL